MVESVELFHTWFCLFHWIFCSKHDFSLSHATITFI